MKKSTKYLFTIFLLLLLTALIFFFSEQSELDSHSLSKRTANIIAHEWAKDFWDNADYYDTNMLAGMLDGPVRKIAHLSIYALLGFGACIGCHLVFGAKNLHFSHIFICILFVILIACCDEINQLSSDGRGSSIRDVIIDTIGGILGIYFVFIIRDFFNHIKAGIGRCKKNKDI